MPSPYLSAGALRRGALRWTAPPGRWEVLLVQHQFRSSPTRAVSDPARGKSDRNNGAQSCAGRSVAGRHAIVYERLLGRLAAIGERVEGLAGLAPLVAATERDG